MTALGLTAAEAATRLRALGPNVVEREQPSSAWTVLLRQLGSPLIWLLLVAAVVSARFGDLADGIAIAAIVAVNTFVGFLQEYRAERAVMALRGLSAPRARVLRDGHAAEVSAQDVVSGDALLLEGGDVVAADAKVVETNGLLAKEAMLTGESMPVEKTTTSTPEGAPLAERRDSVFMGTSIVGGSGCAIVTATGMQTELGKIAHLLASTRDEETPLQARLARVSRTLALACVGIVGLVAALGLWRGLPLMDVFRSAVSLAVAAVPEGLPAIVTVALALGVQRMVARNVLVRRLPAVETLGCASVICTDKTGTLTTGVMTVRELWGPSEQALLHAAASCCDAELGASEGAGTGDPTELAILERAAKIGISRRQIEASNPRVRVFPFDSDRKRMSILRQDGVLYVKGAFEAITSHCPKKDDDVARASQSMAERGLRVLAVATGKTAEEEGLELLGLMALSDPPRREALDAVASARRAGIRTVMITGDHPATAKAIAEELGMLGPDGAQHDVVHARATPADKLEIVRKWKARSHVVAMTGDGVNDAPALREAHIGIAMGRTGTEVTREAADMILTDDNFASIVAAVREGRGIFDNIQKTVVYLLAGNASELCVMLGAALIGLPLPLLPLHLLWINLVTDGLPALALVRDPVDPDAMSKPPRKVDEPMLARAEWKLVAATGVLEATVTLGVFVWALGARDVITARSLAFSVLVFAELFRAFAARSRDRLFLEVGALTNVPLVAVVLCSMLLQIAVLQLPWARGVFQLGAVSGAELGLALALGLVPVTVLELVKLLRRSRRIAAREPSAGAPG
jgi:P-type Ca2+ transporter type 2C